MNRSRRSRRPKGAAGLSLAPLGEPLVTESFPERLPELADKKVRVRTEKLMMAMLTRREHSAKEVIDKLTGKGLPLDVVDEALQHMQDLGLQDDERFAEIFVRSRINRGQGPVRIALELKQRGISATLADQWLSQEESFWLAAAQELLLRRESRSGASSCAPMDVADESDEADESLSREAQWHARQLQQHQKHQQKQKVRAAHSRFLASRGFRPGTIANALACLDKSDSISASR